MMEATSRRYTTGECEERMKQPVYKAEFTLDLELDDLRYEDTVIMPIALPRMVWKVVQGFAEASGIQAKDAIEEFVCDKAWEMVKV